MACRWSTGARAAWAGLNFTADRAEPCLSISSVGMFTNSRTETVLPSDCGLRVTCRSTGRDTRSGPCGAKSCTVVRLGQVRTFWFGIYQWTGDSCALSVCTHREQCGCAQLPCGGMSAPPGDSCAILILHRRTFPQGSSRCLVPVSGVHRHSFGGSDRATLDDSVLASANACQRRSVVDPTSIRGVDATVDDVATVARVRAACPAVRR